MISTVDRLRLAALLGMLGSNHVGERENAAQLVEQFRRQRNLSWADLLARLSGGAGASRPPENEPWPAAPAFGDVQSSHRAHRIRDAIWRWSMLAGLIAIGLMSLTSLASQHASEKRAGVQAAHPCPGGTDCTQTRDRTPETMPKPFLQGLADRRVFEAWRKLAPPGLCSGRGVERPQTAADCATARKLLARFDQRRRTDPVYLDGWNSLTAGRPD
jgi:hypothetical protein